MAKQNSGSRGRRKPVDAAEVPKISERELSEMLGLSEQQWLDASRSIYEPLRTDPREVLRYYSPPAHLAACAPPEGEARELVYGKSSDGRLLFLTLRDALDLAQTRQALSHSKTWGEFWERLPNRDRHIVMPKLEARVIEGSLDRVPDDDDPFGPFACVVFLGLDWPLDPVARMFELIPEDLQYRYGVLHDSGFYTRSLELRAEAMEELVEELKARGLRCHRNDLFVALACG
jgi:hypothetical protein